MAISQPGSLIVQGLAGALLITQGYASVIPSNSLAIGTAAGVTPNASTTGGDGFVYASGQDMRVIGKVLATGPFNLDLITTQDADSGVNYVIKQIAATSITPDANDPGYIYGAEIDAKWPRIGKLVIYNTDIAAIAWLSDARLYYGEK